ncbi:thiamine diphosphokinase [Legionella sp. W05-934-2]|uniref:thiamine diphosphokinase n=1 Tax=Legionella sp. W05-934-2 TaxID=1198649 RepID=UPI0034623E7E
MINYLFDSRYRSILCLNGDLPEASFFRQQQLPVIAADGAANHLKKMRLSPEIIIGDLDSIHAALRNNHPVLFEPCQNSSDFQKSMHYLHQQNLLPAIIVGMNGGYLDHILNNINIFMATNSLFYAPPTSWIRYKKRSIRAIDTANRY